MLYRRLLMNQTKKIQEYKTKYLTFIALENGFQVSNITFDLEYCIDGSGNWNTLSAQTNSPAISSGQIISFRSNISPIEGTDNGDSNLDLEDFPGGCGVFSASKDFEICGDPLSLIYGDNASDAQSYPAYAFQYMFYINSHLKKIHPGFFRNLTLSPYCFQGMFLGCSGLTSVIVLPAVTLASYCYQYMFAFCTGLATVPSDMLPGVVEYPIEGCYARMFDGCTSLITPPRLQRQGGSKYSYEFMFQGCTSLTSIPTMDDVWPNGLDYCFHGMFKDCTSLTSAANFVVGDDEVDDYIFANMFQGCTSLTTPPDLSKISGTRGAAGGYGCFSHMFDGCTSLRTPPKMNILDTGDSTGSVEFEYMFFGCTSLTKAPKINVTNAHTGICESMFQGCTSLTDISDLSLSANDLGNTYGSWCYAYMFAGCTSLTTAPALPSVTVANSCYRSMFAGCTSLTTAPTLPAREFTSAINCYRSMFEGCTRLNYVKMLTVDAPYGPDDYLPRWLVGVSSTGTFVKHPNNNWIQVDAIRGIPPGWTVQTATS